MMNRTKSIFYCRLFQLRILFVIAALTSLIFQYSDYIVDRSSYFDLWDDENNIVEANIETAGEIAIKLPLNKTNCKLVWLLSFPNSGTSYTIYLARSSGYDTAANYRGETLKANEPLVSLSSDTNNEIGPFLHRPTKLKTPEWVLTKTHCTGVCNGCSPEKYILQDPQSFKEGCSETNIKSADGKRVVRTPHYNIIPSKVVHIVRNPFNNLVSRQHYHIKSRPYKKETHESFEDYCKNHDAKYRRLEGLYLRTYRRLIRDLPCRSEWYRYVQWHNMALEMEKIHDMEVLYIHYEDYEQKFNQTRLKLFNFLQLPTNNSYPTFIAGKTYLDKYTPKQQRLAKGFVKEIASTGTWSLIKRYFENITEENSGGW